MSSNVENPPKKMKTAKMIGTHNGTFHCDEALAVYMLRMTDEFKNAGKSLLPLRHPTFTNIGNPDLTRTRDPAKLDNCDIVVDVGATYVPEKLRFDHHQRGFTEVFGHGFSTKLSSAGLIYKHYGKTIIASHLGLSVEDAKINILWLKLYKDYLEAIDGVDNGVSQYPTSVTPAYRSRTDVSSRVGWLNPAWNESVDSATVDARFEKASKLVGEEFINRLEYYANAWLVGKEIIEAGLNGRTAFDPSGRILVFERFAPWKEHLFNIEEETQMPEAQKAIYVIYPDEGAGNWRIQAVPIGPDSFESRKALPEAWRGVRDDALSQVTGVPGGIFVHASGFIGGNQTRDGALQMARLALAM